MGEIIARQRSLFRKEALAMQQISWLGEVVLIRPLSFKLLTLLAVFCAVLVVAFLFYGSYTRRSTLQGQLVSSTGQLKVYAPQFGRVLERYVDEGQLVRKGAGLFLLSSERFSDDGVVVQTKVIDQLLERRQLLGQELAQKTHLHSAEQKSLLGKLDSLQRESRALSQQRGHQEKLVGLASDLVERYKKLLDKEYIAAEELLQRQTTLLLHRQTLQSLTRETAILGQRMLDTRHELSRLPALHESQLAAIQQSLSMVQQEIIESEAQRKVLVTAPQDGLASAVLAMPGQTVDSSVSLMSLVPAGARMQVQLYAPSKDVGFIRVGDPVRVRYQAYPYQKFGQHRATVISISRSSLTANELASVAGMMPGLAGNAEQLYRVQVELDEQTVLAYGMREPLQVGMLLEADVLLESRRLYEWLLEPLYSLSGKI